jgi:cytochrome c553
MKISLRTLATASIFLLAPLALWAQSSISGSAINAEERSALFPSRDMIEHGRNVAETACAECHGMDGISDSEGKPHLAGQRTVFLYRVLRAYQEGERTDQPTPHIGFLNEQALLSVAAYYAGLTPVRVDVPTPEPEQADTPDETDTPEQAETPGTEKPGAETLGDDPFLGIRKSMKKCTKCHDETGNATGSGMPSLTAQDPEYFVTSMQAYVDGGRNHKMMKKLVGKLDEATIREMGVFYAVQEPLRTETQGEGDAEAGRRITEDCELCHGADGNASGKDMPTLAGQDARYFIKAMKAYKDGKRQHEDMFEVVKGLSEDNIQDLATFYAAQEPVQRDVRTPLNSAEWINRCERCHGIDGNSTDPRFPMLAGQDATYLRNTMQAHSAGARGNSTMHKMAQPLSKMDIELIGSYFASQQPRAVVYMNLPCEDADPE